MSSLQRARSLRKPPGLSSDSNNNNNSNAAPSSKGPSGPSGQQQRPRTASPTRLPMKNTTTTTAATARSSNAVPANPVATRAARPASMHLGRTASVSRTNQHGGATATATAGAGAGAHEAPRRDVSSRYPPLTSSNRAHPAQPRPTSASGAATTTASTQGGLRRAATHKRANSSVTKLSSATTLRPPSRDRPGPVTTRTARSSSVANPSPSTPTATAAATSKQVSGAPLAHAHAPAPAQPRLHRPAFSTLQQHYSPAKKLAPKPLTSTYLAPPSPSKLPANVAASAETGKLQAELLQLHLLHRDAAATHAQWRDSARETLGRRFARLGEASAAVADRQRAGVERDNVLALRRWASTGKALDERIQILDEVLGGLWALGDTGGRYSRAVRRFERWIERAQRIEARREDSAALSLDDDHDDQGDSLFVGELDDAWRDDCAGMTRRLEAWRAQLEEIDDLDNGGDDDDDDDDDTVSDPPSASLKTMLDGARRLLHGMLRELRLMEELEQAALASEDEWITKINREVEDENENEVDDGHGRGRGRGRGGDTPRAGAVWRVV